AQNKLVDAQIADIEGDISLQPPGKVESLHRIPVARAPCADLSCNLPKSDRNPRLRILLLGLLRESLRQRHARVDGVFRIGRIEDEDFFLTFALPDQCRGAPAADYTVDKGFQPP